MRSALADLARTGDLLAIEDEVDPVHELGAYLFEADGSADGGPALLFERVRGHDHAVFGNLLNSRERISRLLGVETWALHEVLASAPDRALSSEAVNGGACQEVVVADPDLRRLPVPEFFTDETGRYITAGVIVAKGVTGRRNASFARLKILDSKRAFVGIAPEHHLAVLAREAASRGRSLDVAITLGNHPAVLLAGAYYLELGEDELETAGALLGEALQVVACQTVDVEVPAQAEIVIEATLDAGTSVEEGPVSEFSGLYERYGPGPVVDVRRVTMRSGALFQTILPGYAKEHVLIGAVAIAAVLERRLRRVVPGVTEVAVTPGGCGRLHAVVGLSQPGDGAAEAAIGEGLGAVRLLKRIVVVDDDIDVHDPVQVEWAMATRMKADRDISVLAGRSSSRSDPLASGGVVAKLGINATRRAGDRADWRRAVPPEEMRRRAREALSLGTERLGPTGRSPAR